MIRLAIICFLTSMIRSEKCIFSIDKVNELRQLFNDSERRMEEATRDQKENAVIVLGGGRSGKSTLINYLIGNTLESYKRNFFDSIRIRKFDNNSRGPEIGAGSLSTTSIPIKWNSIRPELQNFDIWDTAGFSDNRGVMQDLNNSFHLHHLTKKVKNLKFMFVVSFEDIDNTNVEQILHLLDALTVHFNGVFRDMFRSISLIISKAPYQNNDDISINYEYLNYKLENNLLSSSQLDISEVSKEFVRNVIDNKQRVGFFRKFRKLGNITSDIDDNIIPALNSCESISKPSHQNIGFAISEKSKDCLLQASVDLLDLNQFIIIQTQVNDWYNEKFKAWSELEDENLLRANRDQLEKILHRVYNKSSFNSDVKFVIQALKINSDIIKVEIMEKLENQINLVEFIDGIITTGQLLTIHAALDGIIIKLYDEITILISLCSLRISDISRIQYTEILRKSKEKFNREIQELWDKVERIKKTEENRTFWDRFFNILGL